MNKSDFFKNFLNYSKGEDFSFFIPGEKFVEPEKVSIGKLVLMKFAAGAAGGLLGSLNSGYLNPPDKDSLLRDLEQIHSHCDLVGIKFSVGPVLLRLVIDADEIPNESLIGRFAIIHEQAHNFLKYSPSLLKSRFKDNKYGAFAQVVTPFSSHERADEFIQKFADKCKHTAFWKHVYTQPWIVDLEGEEIKRFAHPLSEFLGRDSEKFKAGVFGNSL